MNENRVSSSEMEDYDDKNLEQINDEKSSKKIKSKGNDKKLKEEIQILSQKNEELSDKYLRVIAEYENYRRRTAKEKIELTDSVKASVIVNFLPIVDDMDRAMQFIDESSAATSDGIKLIYMKFHEFLKSQGVEEIDALNKDFDFDYHEAVSRFAVEDEGKKDKVIDVVQNGYTLNGKVIRFAKVIVGE